MTPHSTAPDVDSGETLSFQTQGRTLEAYIVRPVTQETAPGMLVIHEAFGLTEDIKAVARRFAQAGYVALAVDLFGQQNRAVCMARMMSGMFVNSLEHQGVFDTRAALGMLAGLPGVDHTRLGATGFCMGGSLAIALACTDDRVKAVAPYYSFNPRPLEAVRRACPVVGSFPGKDPTTPQGRALDAELSAAGVAHDIKIYPAAKHSFATAGRNFDAVASVDAWNRVMAFFDLHILDQPDTLSR
ncbi:dienelactone hydrolase family protein [Deinococcus ruber]|uniref:Carboxymethylenebutenolidase n=1 Tax=Deinococcus ruber TaxID=1848197 RepID=A0A918C7Q3_9DEIO|nr:dienelactone hydrolase family protein [Deinococcus ruber]GGR11014.1 carboxymethylenebutenolidase [Deinococcus ruber]